MDFKQSVIGLIAIQTYDKNINIDKKPRAQMKPSDHTPLELEIN